MLKIAVLCSGKLGLDTLKKVAKSYQIDCVFTDKKSEDIIHFTNQSNIPLFKGNPRNKKGYHFIKDFEIDVIISINYLFLIDTDIINHSKKLTFNLHGSLLPKYRGRTPHVWSIINGETKAGITAHQIDAGCDTGKIIHQIEVPINPEDTGADILKKYTTLYFPLVKKVLQDVMDDNLKLSPQNELNATYFGKRTPEDGQINWNWSKMQIKNWIRAQAYPYPGAFSFINGKKIIIDKVSFSNRSKVTNASNGEVIETEPNILIKVNDGVILLEKIRTENYNFVTGNKFDNENRI